jgi:hypothetical protein
MTAQHAVEMDKEDGEGKSTDRLKDEIRAMHLVYNHKVKEFLDKAHQSAMHRALLSHDADTVRGHHRGMLEAIAKYYASGKGNGMRIGVVVSAEQYMAKFGGGGGGAAAGGGGANPHHVQQVHSYRKGENPFSQAADMTSFFQRGGMSSYKKHAVYGHKLPPPNETRPFQIHDPLARVDMPKQLSATRWCFLCWPRCWWISLQDSDAWARSCDLEQIRKQLQKRYIPTSTGRTICVHGVNQATHALEDAPGS